MQKVPKQQLAPGIKPRSNIQKMINTKKSNNPNPKPSTQEPQSQNHSNQPTFKQNNQKNHPKIIIVTNQNHQKTIKKTQFAPGRSCTGPSHLLRTRAILPERHRQGTCFVERSKVFDFLGEMEMGFTFFLASFFCWHHFWLIPSYVFFFLLNGAYEKEWVLSLTQVQRGWPSKKWKMCWSFSCFDVYKCGMAQTCNYARKLQNTTLQTHHRWEYLLLAASGKAPLWVMANFFPWINQKGLGYLHVFATLIHKKLPTKKSKQQKHNSMICGWTLLEKRTQNITKKSPWTNYIYGVGSPTKRQNHVSLSFYSSLEFANGFLDEAGRKNLAWYIERL